ncbi:helix-turn-helix domain-containing protein [Mucilaginibacter lacusdianchii]|uniref:helix-turn-helix domain-containing protein n=1 Tax=Mucilaginibacter lacusdianchii TaxID=2684211 RepID=UPI00131C069D|nr:helix-turn-helix domain-containing protein [Mucilaginibacter sp. JXJ CY 39]
MKNTLSPHPQTKLTAKIKTELGRKIKPLYVNKDLIAFMKSKIPNNAKDGLVYLHYFKKLVQQVFRSPDPDHYKAFEDEYEAERIAIADEQAFYHPVKWINAEIEYLASLHHAQADQRANELEQVALMQKQTKTGLTKDWLTVPEAMEILGVSKSTLQRRMDNGLPYHQQGRKRYFYLDEINDYLRRDTAA